jgi:hypothetical protein
MVAICKFGGSRHADSNTPDRVDDRRFRDEDRKAFSVVHIFQVSVGIPSISLTV